MGEQPSPVARFFGFAMIAIGALMSFLSGACTLFFVATELSNATDVSLSLGLGLPFIALGAGLIVGGRALSRRRAPNEASRDDF